MVKVHRQRRGWEPGPPIVVAVINSLDVNNRELDVVAPEHAATLPVNPQVHVVRTGARRVTHGIDEVPRGTPVDRTEDANRKAGLGENRLKQDGSLVGNGDTRLPCAIAGWRNTRDRRPLMLMDPHRPAAGAVGDGSPFGRAAGSQVPLVFAFARGEHRTAGRE